MSNPTTDQRCPPCALKNNPYLPHLATLTLVRAAYGDDEFWKQHSAGCIGCGVCTFLCPTCTCFDVRDDAISGRGLRFRCWDTCQFADFSKEASGHDARAQQWQ